MEIVVVAVIVTVIFVGAILVDVINQIMEVATI
jgi:hypothetical protein